MVFTHATIVFPLGRLAQSFLDTYLSRYPRPKHQDREGVFDAVTNSRDASIEHGSIAPTPIYSTTPPTDPTAYAAWLATAVQTGEAITAWWPQAFLDDIPVKSVTEPDNYAGLVVTVL